MTVRQLIKALKTFPLDYNCWAYEGEVTGVIIASKGFDGENGGYICNDGTIHRDKDEQ